MGGGRAQVSRGFGPHPGAVHLGKEHPQDPLPLLPGQFAHVHLAAQAGPARRNSHGKLSGMNGASEISSPSRAGGARAHNLEI